MVGLIQKILIDMILGIGGEDALKKIKHAADVPLDKTFQINTVYSDEEWQRLFAATLKVLKLTPEQAEITYGEYFGKDATQRFPTWFKMSKNSYEFLSIQPKIHNCFASSVLDSESRKAINDKFRIEQFPNQLITHYRSPNKLCSLYIVLAKWILNYYHDVALIEEKKCMKSGQDECEIHIQWTQLGDHSDGAR